MRRFGRLSICGHPFFELLSLAIANSLTVKEVSAPSLGSALAVTEIVLWLSIIRHDERLTVRLSGRLEGSSAEDLRVAACPPSALDIDLSGVTSIDCDGERVLVWLRDHGATLYGEGLLARRLCEATHPWPSLQGR
jgi:hypothetical protein